MDPQKKKLDFANPPVDEVVLSVLFKPLNRFLAPHLGIIWQEFKKDGFVRIIERPPVQPTIEVFPNQDNEIEFEVGSVPAFTRIWLIHETENQILQVQRDRFTFNWRRTNTDRKYPGFSTIFEKFEGFYNCFSETIKNLRVGSVTPLQYELTYIDQLIKGNGWNTFDDIGQIYNLFTSPEQANSFWSNAESVVFRTSFLIQDLHSRLHFAIGNGIKMPEQQPTLQTDFTMRGFPKNTRYPIEMWFKSAHDHIREKFTSIFTEDIQIRVWERNNE